jgi:hypothetical protein
MSRALAESRGILFYTAHSFCRDEAYELPTRIGMRFDHAADCLVVPL